MQTISFSPLEKKYHLVLNLYIFNKLSKFSSTYDFEELRTSAEYRTVSQLL